MQKQLLYFFTIIVLLAVSGCSKDDLPPLNASGTIRYKMDNADNVFKDYDQTSGDATVTFNKRSITVNYSSYVDRVGGQTFYLQIIVPDSIQLQQNYTTDAPFQPVKLYFEQKQTDLSTFYYNSNTGLNLPLSSGSMEITRFDTVPGGKIEGKFSLNNISRLNGNAEPVSYNHNITEGSFSVVVK